MTEESIKTALPIMKTRMNRLRGDTSLDDTALMPRLKGAVETLKENGIELTDKINDILLMVDYAVWRYENRDSPEDMPKWLRRIRRDRFLHTGGGGK